MAEVEDEVDDSIKLKHVKNIQKILQNSAFCTVCLDTSNDLLQLDETEVKGDWEGEALSLRRILEEIFQDTEEILLSNHICDSCKSSAASSYAFIHKTKKTAKIYTEYLNQVDQQINEINARLTGDEWNHAILVIQNYYYDKPEKIKPKKPTPMVCFCYLCGKGYANKRNLIYHLKLHEQGEIGSGKPVKCPHCPKRPCMHEKHLLAFVEQKQKLDPITCIECNEKTGKSIALLIAHVNEKHLNIKTNYCDECEESFYLEYHYRKHCRNNHNEYVCKFCFRKLECEKHLKIHEAKCKDTEKPFPCSECPVLSETKLSHQFHMKTHLPEFSGKKIPKRTKQPPKDKSSARKENKTYECQMCHKILESALELRAHLKSHEKKPNLCIHCNIQFDSRNEYLEHTQSKEHRNNVPFRKYSHHCSRCDYAANTSEVLTAHINKVHLNIRPFKCEYCDKSYHDSGHLKVHLKTHTGQLKPKVCDICGAHLAGPTALKKHKRLHTGDKPYVCTICEDKFTCASVLKLHVQMKHTDETVNCPLCDAKFRTIRNARGHVKRVHWKSKEKFDYTKLEGLSPEDYDLFRDRRQAVV